MQNVYFATIGSFLRVDYTFRSIEKNDFSRYKTVAIIGTHLVNQFEALRTLVRGIIAMHGYNNYAREKRHVVTILY